MLASLAFWPLGSRGQTSQRPPLLLRSAAQSGAPAKYGDGSASQPGLCFEIAQALMRGSDPELRIEGLNQRVPLRRLELMLTQGELDLYFCMLKSARREQMFHFLPVPLYRVKHVLAMRREDEAMPQSWAALQAAAASSPVLVAKGSQLALKLRQMGVRFEEAATSDREILQMLLRGRARMAYGQDLNLRHLLRQDKLEPVLRLGSQAFGEDLQYAVVAKHVSPETVGLLSERLRQLERSGELARLVQLYR